MQNVFRAVALLTVCFTAVPSRNYARGPGDMEGIRQRLAGQHYLITYRDGGPMYGTFYFLHIHFCASGDYITVAESHRTTILDNHEDRRWQDYGKWDVIVFQGRTMLRYISSTGRGDVVPVAVLPDGRLWVRDGVTVLLQGRALCR
jgi:hypothetical protein